MTIVVELAEGLRTGTLGLNYNATAVSEVNRLQETSDDFYRLFFVIAARSSS